MGNCDLPEFGKAIVILDYWAPSGLNPKPFYPQ
jgi:hypothetical protein